MTTHQQTVEAYRATARAYIAAVNGKDLEGILAVYTEDAVVEDPVFRRRFDGKAALRAFYEGVIGRGARLEITGPIRGTAGNVIATPVRAHVPGFYIDVITLTTFAEDGRISHYAAYWGDSDMHPVTDESGA